jgi:hypothetical protein
MRQNKDLEPLSDSTGSGSALGHEPTGGFWAWRVRGVGPEARACGEYLLSVGEQAARVLRRHLVEGHPAAVGEEGYLVIKTPWPGMLRTLFRDPERYKSQYWGKFGNMYQTGDSARKDKDGYIWIIGRMDDVIKVSGYRLGTAEVESALVSHSAVAEAAAVGLPHEIKGNAIHAFVILRAGQEKSDKLAEELRNHVSHEIGPIAKPEDITFVDSLPKTRSGKIMRRLLRRSGPAGSEISAHWKRNCKPEPDQAQLVHKTRMMLAIENKPGGWRKWLGRWYPLTFTIDAAMMRADQNAAEYRKGRDLVVRGGPGGYGFTNRGSSTAAPDARGLFNPPSQQLPSSWPRCLGRRVARANEVQMPRGAGGAGSPGSYRSLPATAWF